MDGWRQLSDDYFRDADRGQVSSLSKEDLAFEAGYLSALVVLGVEQSRIYLHPDPRALQDAAEKLRWPTETMDLAIRSLAQRYESNRDGAQADALLAWARTVQDAASEGEGFLPLTKAQHDAIAEAEPKTRGRGISSLLPDEAQGG
ncbi:MAG: hypothetical protein P4L96_10230 [Rhodoferax sp.]|nr:hypothetical protein [Rhodoferax sp.]